MTDGRLVRLRDWTADGLAWAFVGAAVGVAVLTALNLPLALASGTDVLPGIKVGLFLVGWLVAGIGTLLARPKPAKPTAEPSSEEDEDDEPRPGDAFGDDHHRSGPSSGLDPGDGGHDLPSSGPGLDGEGGLDRRPDDVVLDAVPPARWLTIHEDNELPNGVRLFMAGAGMLLLSLLLGAAGVPG